MSFVLIFCGENENPSMFLLLVEKMSSVCRFQKTMNRLQENGILNFLFIFNSAGHFSCDAFQFVDSFHDTYIAIFRFIKQTVEHL